MILFVRTWAPISGVLNKRQITLPWDSRLPPRCTFVVRSLLIINSLDCREADSRDTSPRHACLGEVSRKIWLHDFAINNNGGSVPVIFISLVVTYDLCPNIFYVIYIREADMRPGFGLNYMLQLLLYCQWRSQSDNLLQLSKFQSITIIHSFRNWLFSQSVNLYEYLYSETKSWGWLPYTVYCYHCHW